MSFFSRMQTFEIEALLTYIINLILMLFPFKTSLDKTLFEWPSVLIKIQSIILLFFCFLFFLKQARLPIPLLHTVYQWDRTL